MIILDLCAVLAVVSLASCNASKCSLVDELNQEAGDGAINCGGVAVGDSTSTVDQCVVKAFDAGRPFLARYAQQGIDSQVVLGVARNRAGAMAFDALCSRGHGNRAIALLSHAPRWPHLAGRLPLKQDK
jgi:hypothetical protein